MSRRAPVTSWRSRRPSCSWSTRCRSWRPERRRRGDRVGEMSVRPPPSPVDYKTLVQDDRIHASLYTDPRIFEDEMERIFRRGWVFVGHDSEIPGRGDYVT